MSAASSSSGFPDPVVICKQFGSAFVIDPIAIASMAVPNQTWANNRVAYAFPSTGLYAPPESGGANSAYYQSSKWDPWRTANSNTQQTWPVRRVTFQQANGWQMNTQVAEHYFRGKDDLATEFPARADHPAAQTWDKADLNADGNPDPLARQWAGDYSWMVSVVPTSNAARDAMARSPESYAYDVSVVVFYKRSVAASPAISDTTLARQNAAHERLVNARIVSTGLNGGELLLRKVVDNINTSDNPYSLLKAGQWIMLCGPHPESTTSEPRFVMNWYQVLSIDAEGTSVTGFNSATDRVVAVRGPEWPWQPSSNLTYNGDLPNNLCVAICRGAVAVHTKTIRLDSLTSGGGAGGGMTIVTPPGSTDPKYGVY
jgi:hypothetical protein